MLDIWLYKCNHRKKADEETILHIYVISLGVEIITNTQLIVEVELVAEVVAVEQVAELVVELEPD